MADWKQTNAINVDQPPLRWWERLYLPQIVWAMVLTFKRFWSWRRKREMTVQYPEQTMPQPIGIYRGLHRLNRDEQGRVACVACFMCETACPANCIHIVGDEAPWPDREKYPVQFDIDELVCIYCGMCEEACPVDAIELTPEFRPVGHSRQEMIYTKQMLLDVYDQTIELKPRKNPPITDYAGTGGQTAEEVARHNQPREFGSH